MNELLIFLPLIFVSGELVFCTAGMYSEIAQIDLPFPASGEVTVFLASLTDLGNDDASRYSD